MGHQDSSRPTGRTVVIVEDEFLVRDYAIALLEELGFPIVDFPSGDLALDFLEEHASEVFVLFTDIRMPGAIDGVGLARRVRASWPWIRIMIASGHVNEGELALPKDVKFLTKPWLPLDVLRTVDEWSAGRPANPVRPQ
jgi:CheY-like chemotaxis protein